MTVKRFLVLLILLIPTLSLILFITLSSTEPGEQSHEETLFNSVRVQLPKQISILEPQDTELSISLAQKKDLRTVSVAPMSHQIDEVIRKVDGDNDNYKILDEINKNNLRVVTFELADDDGDHTLFRLYAGNSAAPYTTLVFQIFCYDKNSRLDDFSGKVLTCEEARLATDSLARSVDVYDLQTLLNSI